MDQLNNRGLSNPGLKFGLWYTAHKILLRKIFVSVSIAAILLLYFFNIYSSFKIFVIQKNTDSEVLLSLMSDSSGIQSIQSRFRPQQIQITGVSVLPREKDSLSAEETLTGGLSKPLEILLLNMRNE